MEQALKDMAKSNKSNAIDSHVNANSLMVDEIREDSLHDEPKEGNKRTKSTSLCDICFLLNFSKIAASYLCYLCKQYVCDECYEKHDKVHDLVKLKSKESERESSRREFLGKMRNERKERKRLNKEKVCIVDKLNVNHELDLSKDCWITGLCGVNNTSWAISDHQNYCIKIFSVGSNILQRYIRFGANPWDITEINIKRESTEQERETSVTNRTEPDKQCMLAVSIPEIRRIWLIDITKSPAVKIRSIESGKFCYSIDFIEDKIYSLCSDHGFLLNGRWLFSVMSTDGVMLKTITTDIDTTYVPYLTAFQGRVLLTDWNNDKVMCMNNDGEVVSQKTIEGSMPFGITKDPANNKVYMCAWGHGKIYRLDSSLESFEDVLDLKSLHLESPETLCFHRDKLYLGHDSESIHRNCINVVSVL